MRSPKNRDMAAMKAQMREGLNNVKVYGDDPSLNTRGSPGARMSIAAAERRASGMSPRAGGAGMASPKGRRSPKTNQ